MPATAKVSGTISVALNDSATSKTDEVLCSPALLIEMNGNHVAATIRTRTVSAKAKTVRNDPSRGA